MTYKWTGIHKLMEECAELTVELAKLAAYPDGKHPDEHYAGPLLERVQNELGDVLAAISFLTEHNKELDSKRIWERMEHKRAKLEKYHTDTDGMSGIYVEDNK